MSISTDPERDNPEALLNFAKKNNVEDMPWVFLTGEKPNVDHIITKLGQYNEQVEAHSTLILAGNVNKRHWVKIAPMMPPQQIVAKLKTLLES